jgi:hypothetical protein
MCLVPFYGGANVWFNAASSKLKLNSHCSLLLLSQQCLHSQINTPLKIFLCSLNAYSLMVNMFDYSIHLSLLKC